MWFIAGGAVSGAVEPLQHGAEMVEIGDWGGLVEAIPLLAPTCIDTSCLS